MEAGAGLVSRLVLPLIIAAHHCHSFKRRAPLNGWRRDPDADSNYIHRVCFCFLLLLLLLICNDVCNEFHLEGTWLCFLHCLFTNCPLSPSPLESSQIILALAQTSRQLHNVVFTLHTENDTYEQSSFFCFVLFKPN